MRQAGTLSNREQAQTLADYLLTQGIIARVEADGGHWALWIRDEDQLPQAIVAIDEFQANPGAEKYRLASDRAAALRQQQQRDDEKRRKNIVQVRDRWQTSSLAARPITMLLIGVSVFVSLATDFGSENNSVMQAVMFQSLHPDGAGNLVAPSATYDIDHGQVWRLVTPIFIHFGFLHILFNAFAIYSFGSSIETRLGTLRYGLLILILAVLSNYAQFYCTFVLRWESQPSIRFGGLSGVAFGLFGYLWMKSKFDPFFGIRIPSNSIVSVMVFYVLCWTGAIGSIANWAHTAGLIAGMAIGYGPIAWRNMTKSR